MSSMYHVAHGDTWIGQLSSAEIFGRVGRGELDPFDHVFDEPKNEWVAIIVHPEFAKDTNFWTEFRMQNLVPTQDGAQRSQAVESRVNKNLESLQNRGNSDLQEMKENGQEPWYVLKGDQRFGPFDYLELIRMLQDQSVCEWDYVWTKRLKEWTRIASLDDFKPESIRKLRTELDEKLGRRVNEVFFRRRFARAQFESSILIHDNKRLFKGQSMEMSAGGIGIQLAPSEATLKVGDHVHLHVKPSPETPAFNSACEVISARPISSGDPQSPVLYGFRFIGLEDKVRNEIDTWATKKKTEDAA